MADTGKIDPTQLDLVTAPCPNCPPSTPRPHPDWSRLASLARLVLAVARADLERERRQGDQAARGEQP